MLPDFLIAGAPKAGTTWLYKQLTRSPRVFLPDNKEPRYFAIDEGEIPDFVGPAVEPFFAGTISSYDDYVRLFEGASASQKIGEASTDYLFRSATVAKHLSTTYPSMRVVVILRDPADRAYSNWLQMVRDGHEDLSFRDALEAERDRVELNWVWWFYYLQRGFYAKQLKPFFEHLPSEQLLILTYDQLQHDPFGLVKEVCRFLDLPVPSPTTDFRVRVNESGVPRSQVHSAFHRALATWPSPKVRRLLPRTVRSFARKGVDSMALARPAMSAEDKRFLRGVYRPDIEELERLTGLDLAAWK